VDADREVRGTDGAGREADRGATGQLAMGLGHERGCALVAGADDPDAGRVEALEEAEEALAGHGERVAHADRAKGIGDVTPDCASGFRLRLRRGGLQLGLGGGQFGRGLERHVGFGLGLGLGGEFGDRFGLGSRFDRLRLLRIGRLRLRNVLRRPGSLILRLGHRIDLFALDRHRSVHDRRRDGGKDQPNNHDDGDDDHRDLREPGSGHHRVYR
jgi:hypothetical protein